MSLKHDIRLAHAILRHKREEEEDFDERLRKGKSHKEEVHLNVGYLKRVAASRLKEGKGKF